MNRRINLALLITVIGGLATMIGDTLAEGGGVAEIAIVLVTTGAALVARLWGDDDGDGVPNVRDVSIVVLCSAVVACGSAPVVVADVDTGDQSAGVTVDGWGLSASCKLGHVCVSTPIAPLCWPIPDKLADRVCSGY